MENFYLAKINAYRTSMGQRVAILFCLFCLATLSYGQVIPVPEWTRTYQNGCGGVAFAETENGYLIGCSTYTTQRTDKLGNILKKDIYDDSGKSALKKIIKTSDGGYLLIGNSSSPISAYKTAASRGVTDFWVVKISSSGAKLWDKAFGGSEEDVLTDAIVLPDGNILLAGYSFSGVSGERTHTNRTVVSNGEAKLTADYWIVKISQSGTKIWDKAYGGGGVGTDYLESVASTSDGGLLLVGMSFSDAGYEKTSDQFASPESYSSGDVWIIKTNGTGAKQWDKAYGGVNSERALNAIKTPEGGFVVASTSNSLISGNKTVDAGVDDANGEYMNHLWYFKISNSGELTWQKTAESIPFMESLTFFEMLGGSDGFYTVAEIEYRADAHAAFRKFDFSGNEVFVTGVSTGVYTKVTFFASGKLGEFFVGANIGILYQEVPDMTNATALTKFKSEQNSGPSVAITAASIQGNSFINFKDDITLSARIINFDYSKIEIYDNNVKVLEEPARATGGHSIRLNSSKPGVHYITARATDASGAIVDSDTKTYTVFALPVRLYAAINLNGPTMMTDHLNYESSTALPNFSYQAKSYSNQSITLNPSTDIPRANLIRSSLYGTASAPATFTLTNVPNENYEIYLYTWEDNTPSVFSVSVQGTTVLSNYNSGQKGQWKKLGPFQANVTDGKIQIKTSGGDANISAIEVWRMNSQFSTAINVNGPELTIDGKVFKDGRDVANLDFRSGFKYENQSIALNPGTGAARSKMIRSSIYSTSRESLDIAANDIWGTFDVYLYVWEDNVSSTYSIKLNGEGVVKGYKSGSKGSWAKLGPFRTRCDGSLAIEAYGGDANISGVEMYSVLGIFEPTQETAGRVLTELAPVEKEETLVKAFPNPVKNDLTLIIPESSKGDVSVQITDLQGQVFTRVTEKVEAGDSLSINTSTLKPGLYILKVRMNGSERSFKITKE